MQGTEDVPPYQYRYDRSSSTIDGDDESKASPSEDKYRYLRPRIASVTNTDITSVDKVSNVENKEMNSFITGNFNNSFKDD